MFFFFFFKQKTAYEMRISDWSSDVCSSDLDRRPAGLLAPGTQCVAPAGAGPAVDGPRHALDARRQRSRREPWPRHPLEDRADAGAGRRREHAAPGLAEPAGHRGQVQRAQRAGGDRDLARPRGRRRSEEHTTELQSLMRTSYAVYCLQKKKTITNDKPCRYMTSRKYR